MTLEESLLSSLNVPTVKLCAEIGVDKVHTDSFLLDISILHSVLCFTDGPYNAEKAWLLWMLLIDRLD